VDYTGLGIIPEDFFYEGPQGTIFAAGSSPSCISRWLRSQDISGKDGMVNDAVLVLVDGADRDAIASQLTEALSDLGLGATVSTRDDADAVRVLYEDIDNDQRFWNALSALVLFAAALAAFNLINRIVEAQRREIGIGMALGVPRRQLAIRPMLIGVQVAVLGTIAGLAVGFLVGRAFANLLESFLPLPEHRTPFQFDVYAQAAALSIVIPIAASAVPVWRALRVEPIEAIRTGHLAARSNRLTGWTGKLRLPGSTMIADADPQCAAHPAPHRADRRRRRRGDHRPGGSPRDARQLRSNTRARRRRVHQGRRRPGRRPTRHVLPR
jgi:putative ABC transport system permease protein